METNSSPFAGGTTDAQPALRDAVANASYYYDEALMAYEDALSTRDASKRGAAEAHLNEAARRLSAAQSALVAARAAAPARPTFADLLADPGQQLDPAGEVMRSVLAYRAAAPAAASASPTWMDYAPAEVRAAVYVHDRIVASTIVATAS
ncbi:hypothetical protein GCM10027596_24150 [Nocardioides korecus]